MFVKHEKTSLNQRGFFVMLVITCTQLNMDTD